MSFQLIRPELNNDISITLHCRDRDFKKRQIRVLGFKPYFYVPDEDPVPESEHILDEEEGFEGVYGAKLKKIICDNPLAVWDSNKKIGLRTKFTKHWEADIPFLRRFLIDLGLTDGFTLLNDSDVVRYTDIIPSDSPSDKILTVIFDIEVVTERRFPDPAEALTPITIVTLWDNQSKKYLTIILDKTDSSEWRTKDWMIVRTTDENKLLRLVVQYFNLLKPDIIAGWNVDFDVSYLYNRIKKKDELAGKLELSLGGSHIFNMIDGYAIVHKRLGNRLKEVAEEDKLLDIYTEFKQEMWKDPNRREEGIKANKSHVEVLVIEDDMRKITSFFWGLKQVVGLEDINGATSHGVLVDTLFLREAKGKYVLPSSAYGESKGFKGAIVLEPHRGKYENVGAYDMSRYYPNIVIGYKVSPDKKGELGPNVCKKLSKQRDKIEEELIKITIDTPEYKRIKERRDEVKYLLNSVWGYYGWSGSRVFEREKAAFVASRAREGLLYIKRTAEENNLKVLYGDTDSIFIQSGDISSGKITDMLNEALKEYCKEEGIPILLSIKLDRVYGSLLLTDAKKRTAGHVIWENGKDCDYIEVKGWDSIRRDSSHLTREVLPKVFDSVLRSGTEGLIDYLRETKKKIETGGFDMDFIAINKQLHKKDITEPTIDFYKGSVWSNQYFGFDIQSGDMVKMIPVEIVHGYPPTKVICYLDKEEVPWDKVVINYDKIVTRTLRNRVRDILDIAGMSWDEVEGVKDLVKVWT